MIAPDPELIYHQHDDGKPHWETVHDWTHPVNGALLTVPAGFEFDLASIPRIFWWVPGFAPFELSTAAPLLHDYIYRYEGHLPQGCVLPTRSFARRDADRYFRLVMKEEGVGVFRRTLAWVAVRIGGWFSWRGW